MIDTHAHVHDRQYDGDRDATVARARAAGVATMLDVGCDLDDSQRALETARRYGDYASIGIHPHEAKDAPADIAAAFAPLLEDPRAVAIGETGLDYYYDHSPREQQARVLRAQIALARERALPVVFHQRDAFEDFVAILRDEWRSGMRGVVHCFTGDAAQAERFVGEFGLRLGIGGVLTFKTAGALRAAVAAVGVDALVLETDAPYLAPVPLRGRRNEPAFAAHTLEALAHLLAIAPGELEAILDANARALFGLP